MSAIFGIIAPGGRPIDAAWTDRMQGNLAHRGPDGQGVWQQGNAMLGHCLLRVTPESQYEQSPLLLQHLVVAADARLDERERLMDQLRIPPAQRLQITDPELIGRAYLQWNERVAEHLTGDFAFSIWDSKEQRLFCARDHVGVKPFVYAYVNGLFAFSTEMKAVVDLPFVGKELSREYQIEYVVGFQHDAEMTIWNDVRRIRPAHLLIVDAKGIQTRPYWNSDMPPDVRFRRPEDYVEAFRELLIQSVRDRIRTDYPIGATLSGGLDSSAVTCIAAQLLREQNRSIHTVSSVLPPGYEGPETDEREYIAAVLQQEPNIIGRYVDSDGLEYGAGLKEVFEKHYDVPNAFYYMDEALFGALEQNKVRTVLSGYFGDMVASNYSIMPLPLLLTSGRFVAFSRHLKKRKQISGKPGRKIMKQEVLLPLLPYRISEAIRRFRGQAPEMNWDALPLHLQPEELKRLRNFWAESYDTGRYHYRKALWSGAGENFQEEWDCSTGHRKTSISYPLADSRILKFLLGIPPELIQYGGQHRGLFRGATNRVVPQGIMTRKDKGYYVPLYQDKMLRGFSRLSGNLNYSSVKMNEEPVDKARLKKILAHLIICENPATFVLSIWNVQQSVMLASFKNWTLDVFSNH
jgi:asparagine synthase (glutamine-hydrolysing)